VEFERIVEICEKQKTASPKGKVGTGATRRVTFTRKFANQSQNEEELPLL
jgi:hypothetical protein